MKETYLSRDFRETAAQSFPSQAKELNAFFDARLNVLLLRQRRHQLHRSSSEAHLASNKNAGARRLAVGMRSAAEDGHRNVQQSLLSVRRLRLVEACIGRWNGSAWVLPLLLHGEGTEYGY